MNSRNLTTALGLIAAAIGTEHFFTFSLSSLPTTKEFFAGDEAKIRDVRHAYAIATGLSLAFAVFVNNYTARSSEIRAVIDRICVLLAQ